LHIAIFTKPRIPRIRRNINQIRGTIAILSWKRIALIKAIGIEIGRKCRTIKDRIGTLMRIISQGSTSKIRVIENPTRNINPSFPKTNSGRNDTINIIVEKTLLISLISTIILNIIGIKITGKLKSKIRIKIKTIRRIGAIGIKNLLATERIKLFVIISIRSSENPRSPILKEIIMTGIQSTIFVNGFRKRKKNIMRFKTNPRIRINTRITPFFRKIKIAQIGNEWTYIGTDDNLIGDRSLQSGRRNPVRIILAKSSEIDFLAQRQGKGIASIIGNSKGAKKIPTNI
jgi:hypothetical protein